MTDRRLFSRLVLSVLTAVGVVLGLTAVVPSYGGGGGAAGAEKKALITAYDRATSARGASGDAAWSHTHAGPVALLTRTGAALVTGDGHGHDHSDPTTKNAISRAGADDGAVDPTTAAQARRNAAAVAAQRAEPDPDLVRVPRPSERRTFPQNRYVMAGGCYALRGPDGWVVRDGSAYAATAARPARAEKFHFQATTLGRYLLWDSTGAFLSSDDAPLGPGVAAKTEADASSIWTVRNPAGFVISQGRDRLTSGDPVTTGAGSPFALQLVEGCGRWPEIGTQVSGRPFAGVSAFQEVRGATDNHTHGMAFRFLSGGAHCGKPWSPYGVTQALVDCPDHRTTNGVNALEAALTGEPRHDPVGWPTFVDWPAPESLTHEGTYYKWMERSWRGGLRLFTNLLVENNQLCQLYPFKDPRTFAKTQCDDTKSVELQAHDMRRFERYVDAQYGGPGKGWYRIVTSPWQARRVINQGKLAVIMGIETSIPFGCTVKATVPQCDEASIDAALDRAHRMGVRQMEIVNKFDNALSGITGDTGQTGALVNSANFAETGSFWRMRTCEEPVAPGVHDKEQYAQPDTENPEQDAIFGAIADLFGDSLQPAPVYPPAPHCNQTGLSDLGKHLVKRLAQRNMVFDPDHMSVKARTASLDVLERMGYPGVLSSHSWATPDAYPRIYKMGGFITPYAGDSTGFVDKWRQHLKWADKRFYFGFGYGADINGLGAQGDPRPTAEQNPVTYPFRGYGGVTVRKQVSGERVYDINDDGVAHYGLYPDWFEDLEHVAGAQGPAIRDDMLRGAEAYLQMWERAEGVSNDACRQPSVAKRASLIRGLRSGLTVKQVLLRAGQPHQRLGTEFTYCARAADGDLTRVRLDFTRAGRLT